MQLKIFTLSIFLFLVATPIYALTPECIQIQTSQSITTCTDLKAYINSNNPFSDCGDTINQRLCCCPATTLPKAKPKTLIISSIIGFFAILTIVTLLYKKNE